MWLEAAGSQAISSPEQAQEEVMKHTLQLNNVSRVPSYVLAKRKHKGFGFKLMKNIAIRLADAQHDEVLGLLLDMVHLSRELASLPRSAFDNASNSTTALETRPKILRAVAESACSDLHIPEKLYTALLDAVEYHTWDACASVPSKPIQMCDRCVGAPAHFILPHFNGRRALLGSTCYGSVHQYRVNFPKRKLQILNLCSDCYKIFGSNVSVDHR